MRYIFRFASQLFDSRKRELLVFVFGSREMKTVQHHLTGRLRGILRRDNSHHFARMHDSTNKIRHNGMREPGKLSVVQFKLVANHSTGTKPHESAVKLHTRRGNG